MQIFPADMTKEAVFEEIKNDLKKNGIGVQSSDPKRPWGGFHVIKDSSLLPFAEHFFPDFDIDENPGLKLSPKVLIVEPGKRLSWQYHNRRSELWTIAAGDIGISVSDSDREAEITIYSQGDTVAIEQGQRHRAEGLDTWGIIAEIWQHTDAGNPSNEDDIVRISDDYGR